VSFENLKRRAHPNDAEVLISTGGLLISISPPQRQDQQGVIRLRDRPS
jgi:hypothetical protein